MRRSVAVIAFRRFSIPNLIRSSWTWFRTDENTLKLSTLQHTTGSRVKHGMTNTKCLTWKRMCSSFIVHCSLWNAVRRTPIMHYELWNEVRRKPIVHYALWIMHYELCIVKRSSAQPIMHCELFIMNYKALYNVRACVCVWGVLNHLNPFYGEKRRFTVKNQCFTVGKRRFSMRKAAVLISNITNVAEYDWIPCQARDDN